MMQWTCVPNPLFLLDEVEDKDQIGIVTGLA
jgi:hypothetical protein